MQIDFDAKTIKEILDTKTVRDMAMVGVVLVFLHLNLQPLVQIPDKLDSFFDKFLAEVTEMNDRLISCLENRQL